MNIIKIKELKNNYSKLSQSFKKNEYMLIIRKGKPIGIALPFSGELMEQGLMPWMALKAFESGDLSLGQLANYLDKNQADTLKILGQLHISVADYDLQEDIDGIEKLCAL